MRDLDFVSQEINVKAKYFAIVTSSTGNELFTITSNICKSRSSSLLKVRMPGAGNHENFVNIIIKSFFDIKTHFDFPKLRCNYSKLSESLFFYS